MFNNRYLFLVSDFDKSNQQNSNKSSKIINIFKGNNFGFYFENNKLRLNLILIYILILDGSKRLSKVFKKLQINSNGKYCK